MKTAELIRRLQEADPSGDLDVVVGCEDILFIESLPSYYDGPKHLLVRDPAKAPYYDVVGGLISYEGEKIKIHCHMLEDALANNPDLPIEIRGGNANNRARHEEAVKAWRQEAIELREQAQKLRENMITENLKS